MEKRGWLTESQYAQVVALCQLLPGPASSQTGFAIGLLHAGWRGALAACLAFTLPSAVLMYAFALAMPALDAPLASATFSGLKLLTVAVVAHAVIGMARTLAPDWPRRGIAVASALAMILSSSVLMQPALVLAGMLAGLAWRGVASRTAGATAADLRPRYGRRAALACLLVFAALLGASFLLPPQASPLGAATAAVHRAGALVFGGGHVVLPLLRDAVVTPGLVAEADFLAGYGAAQIVPGPIFSFAAFLGARITDGSAAAAGLMLVALFLPGFLLVAAALPAWHRLSASPVARRAVAGANAAVTGLLAAALWDPVIASGIADLADAAIAVAALVALYAMPRPVLSAAAICVGASLARTLLAG